MSQPPLLVPIVFHPKSSSMRALALQLHRALNDDPVVPGLRIPTQFCAENGTGKPAAALDLDQAACSFVVPLIDNVRWRVLCAVTLVATITASATRTALIGVGFVMLWWILCYFRSVFSIRVAGTAFAAITMVGMFIVPFLSWDPSAFTERAYIWAASVRIWLESPLFGKGFDWFANDAQQQPCIQQKVASPG